MSDVAVSVTTLTKNTRSSDLVGSGTTVTTADTAVIANVEPTYRLVIVLEELNSGAATVTFLDGDNPPSAVGELTASGVSVSLSQADVRLVVLEGGRFVHDDGAIRATVGTNSVKFSAYRIPNTV